MNAAALAVRGPGAVSVEVPVAVPVEVAFAAMADWAGQSAWIPLTTVRVIVGDGRSPGSVVEARTGLGRLEFRDVMEVTTFVAPSHIEVVHVGRLVRGPGEMRVREMSDGRALIIWQEWLHLPLGAVGRLAWPVLRLAAAAGLRRSFRKLARTLEARSE